jgi:hypothetical protein
MFARQRLLAGTTLTPLQQSLILGGILGWDNYGEILPEPEALLLWMAELLQQLPWLAAEPVQLLLQKCQHDIRQAVSQPVAGHWLLAFLDGRYATWSGCDGYLDLQTGNMVAKPASPAFESLAYNLSVLFQQRMTKLAKEGTGATSGNAATGSPAKVLD